MGSIQGTHNTMTRCCNLVLKMTELFYTTLVTRWLNAIHSQKKVQMLSKLSNANAFLNPRTMSFSSSASFAFLISLSHQKTDHFSRHGWTALERVWRSQQGMLGKSALRLGGCPDPVARRSVPASDRTAVSRATTWQRPRSPPRWSLAAFGRLPRQRWHVGEVQDTYYQSKKCFFFLHLWFRLSPRQTRVPIFVVWSYNTYRIFTSCDAWQHTAQPVNQSGTACFLCAETFQSFFLLRRFGHLSYGCIKIRRNSVR